MTTHKNDREPSDEIRDIPKLMQEYSKGRRATHFLVFMIIFLAFSAAIGIPSKLAGNAYRSGNMLLFGICIAFLIPTVILLICFSIPPLGGRWLERIGDRFNSKEGYVTSPSPDKVMKLTWKIYMALFLFVGSIETCVILGLLGYIPDGYMQPISAIYTVPFLLFMAFQLNINGFGALPFAWAILYALHAILVVAGAPIQFQGEWKSLNILLPIAGYGLLLGMIAYIGNRLTYRKLKRRVGMGKEMDHEC
jgi:hypothetical protein